MTTLKLTNVDKNFGKGSSYVEVLKDINFVAKTGEMVLILGPSGSGKSTFLTIAGGLQKPSAGTVQINQQAVQQLSAKQRDQLRLKEIGFILQAYNLVPYLTVQEQFQLVDKVKKQGNLTPDAFKKLLAQLEIDQLVKKFPNQLSGGQTQRVAIARALYTDPAIILADEPTAALDSDRVQEVGRILNKLAHDRQKTVIVVTHDQRLLDYADRVYQIMDGKLTAQQ